MRALSEMTSRILPPCISLPSVVPGIPIWTSRPWSWNLLFAHPQGDSGMTKLGVEETHSVINYYPEPLSDAVCQMKRVMRWEPWSTTCGMMRSILCLAGSWLPWQHPCYRAPWLCERLWGKLVASFGSQSWSWRAPYPGIVFSLFLWVKGENMAVPFWSHWFMWFKGIL